MRFRSARAPSWQVLSRHHAVILFKFQKQHVRVKLSVSGVLTAGEAAYQHSWDEKTRGTALDHDHPTRDLTAEGSLGTLFCASAV